MIIMDNLNFIITTIMLIIAIALYINLDKLFEGNSTNFRNYEKLKQLFKIVIILLLLSVVFVII